MIQLRNNQFEPINKAINFFNSSSIKPSLIVLPTAWGKSILTAFVARNIKDKLLVLQPSKELLAQNYSKYIALCKNQFDVNAGIYSASFGKKEVGKITYATIGSIKNYGKEFKRLGFTKMLIDEAHLYPRNSDSMLGKFLIDSEIKQVLGITATPIKLQSNYLSSGNAFSKIMMLTSQSKHGKFYKDILHISQIQEMVECKYWSKLIYQSVKFDKSMLIFNSAKSEYTENSIEKAYKANDIESNILEALNIHKNRKHILVFVPNIATAEKLSNICPNSAYIHSLMPSNERDNIISQFRNGNIRTIFNVRVLTTGFDYTGIDCIILGISTASIALYYQILGRATRIDNNKEDALIVDFGGNIEKFGKIEDIYFEYDKIWRMFGTDDRLLTGIPVHEIGQHTKKTVKQYYEQRAEQRLAGNIIMPFGKYKGCKISEIPLHYIRWALENISNLNNDIKNAFQTVTGS